MKQARLGFALLVLSLSTLLNATHFIKNDLTNNKASVIIEDIGDELYSKTGINAYVVATNERFPVGLNLVEHSKRYESNMSKPFVLLIFAPNALITAKSQAKGRVGLITSSSDIGELYNSSDVKDATIDALKDKASKGAREGFSRRTKDGSVNTGGLNAESRMADENVKFQYKMMTKEERLATAFMSELRSGLKDGASNKSIKALQAFDGINSRMKGNLLTMTYSWIKNNFKENAIRTFAEDGMLAGIKNVKKQGEAIAALVTGPVNKEMKDLLKVTQTERAATAYMKGLEHNGAANVARRYGAINGNQFQDILKKSSTEEGSKILTARMGKKDHEAALKALENKHVLLKGYDKALDFARKTIGETGSLMENATRLQSWEHGVEKIALPSQKKAIKKLGYADALIADPSLHKVYEASTKRVNRIFFDYSDLSLGEEEVLKRFMPFYSFYFKNVKYTGDLVADELKTMAKYMKVPVRYTNMDASLNNIDMTVPEYQREGFHGKGADGRELYDNKVAILDIWIKLF